jgi:hypothetical protein
MPNYYQDCLQKADRINMKTCLEDIQKDLHRLFPSHEIFMKPEGINTLYNVLKAYAAHNQETGHC